MVTLLIERREPYESEWEQVEYLNMGSVAEAKHLVASYAPGQRLTWLSDFGAENAVWRTKSGAAWQATIQR